MNRHLLATIAAAACTAVMGLGCDHNGTDTNAPAQNTPGNTNMQPPQYSADPGTQAAVGPNYADASFGVRPGDTNGPSGGLAGARTGDYDPTSTSDSYGKDAGSRAADKAPRDYPYPGTTGNSAVGGAGGFRGDAGMENVSPLSPPAGYAHTR